MSSATLDPVPTCVPAGGSVPSTAPSAASGLNLGTSGPVRVTGPCPTVLLGSAVNCGTKPASRTSLSADCRLTPTTAGEDVHRPLPSHQPPTAAAVPRSTTTVATMSQRRTVTFRFEG